MSTAFRHSHVSKIGVVNITLHEVKVEGEAGEGWGRGDGLYIMGSTGDYSNLYLSPNNYKIG